MTTHAPASSTGDLRLLLVSLLDSIQPRLHPQLACQLALALDALIDPLDPPPLSPATPAADVVEGLDAARALVERLLGGTTTVAECLALGEAGRHLKAASATLSSTE